MFFLQTANQAAISVKAQREVLFVQLDGPLHIKVERVNGFVDLYDIHHVGHVELHEKLDSVPFEFEHAEFVML